MVALAHGAVVRGGAALGMMDPALGELGADGGSGPCSIRSAWRTERAATGAGGEREQVA